jgi:hypothetical protein
MRRHLETLQNCYDTRRFLRAKSVSCVSYVPFCTNLCAIRGLRSNGTENRLKTRKRGYADLRINDLQVDHLCLPRALHAHNHDTLLPVRLIVAMVCVCLGFLNPVLCSVAPRTPSPCNLGVRYEIPLLAPQPSPGPWTNFRGPSRSQPLHPQQEPANDFYDIASGSRSDDFTVRSCSRRAGCAR